VYDADRRRGEGSALRLGDAGRETLDPRLYLRGQDARDLAIAEEGVGVAAQHALDVGLARGAMDLGLAPRLGVVTEQDPAGVGVDVLAGDDRRGDLIDPALGVDLASEVAGVLLSPGVSVAGAPAPIRALLDVPRLTGQPVRTKPVTCEFTVFAAV
jgi:hypothetical protein